MSVLNRRIGAWVDLRDIDFDCFEVIDRHGPIGPSGLARRVGVHLATMTGILGRLEAGGWISRNRVDTDRRAVVVESIPARQIDIAGVYNAIDAEFENLCTRYSDSELAVITDFLRRMTEVGRSAAVALIRDDSAQ